MKKIIKTTLLLGLIFASCQKDVNIPNESLDETGVSNTELTQDSARTEFSKILSKAIYNEPDLRQFIKAAAMDEFDNDQDVFIHL